MGTQPGDDEPGGAGVKASGVTVEGDDSNAVKFVEVVEEGGI